MVNKCEKNSTSLVGPDSLFRGTRLQMLLQGEIMPERAGTDAGEAEHSLS